MNTAAKGAVYERRSKALLEVAGYTVLRSARSGGLWDLMGYNEAGFVVVQVKVGKWPGPLESERLATARVPANCTRLVHRWRPGCLVPDVRVLD